MRQCLPPSTSGDWEEYALTDFLFYRTIPLLTYDLFLDGAFDLFVCLSSSNVDDEPASKENRRQSPHVRFRFPTKKPYFSV